MNDFLIIGAGLCASIIAKGLIDRGYSVRVLASVDTDFDYEYSDLYENRTVERAHVVGGNTLHWHAGLIYPDKCWMANNGYSLELFSKRLRESLEISSSVFGNSNFNLDAVVRPHNSRIYYIKGPRIAKFSEHVSVTKFSILNCINLGNKTITIDGDHSLHYQNLVIATDAIGAADIYSKHLVKSHVFNILDHPLAYIGEIETTKFISANLKKSIISSKKEGCIIKRGLVVSVFGVRHMVYLRPTGSNLLHRTMISDLPSWRKYLRILTNASILKAAIYLKWGIELPCRRFEAFLVMQMPGFAKLDTFKRTISYGDSSFYDGLCKQIGSKLSVFKFIKRFSLFEKFIYFPGNHFTSTLCDMDIKKYEYENSIFFVGSSVISGNSYTNTGVQIMVAAANFLARFGR